MKVSVSIDNAKVSISKDIEKVLEYFQYTTGTTLDVMLATGVLRNSVTWYVRELEELGLLQAIARKPDCHTGRLAKYYSANPELWVCAKPRQLSLFEEDSAWMQ